MAIVRGIQYTAPSPRRVSKSADQESAQRFSSTLPDCSTSPALRSVGMTATNLLTSPFLQERARTLREFRPNASGADETNAQRTPDARLRPAPCRGVRGSIWSYGYRHA